MTNVVKRLVYRNWLKNENPVLNKLLEKKSDDGIYNIKLDIDLVEYETYEPFVNKKENFIGTNVILFIYNQDITGKSSVLTDFINKYYNYHKIIIVNFINDKNRNLLTSGKFIEVSMEEELLTNISEHVCCPQFHVLSKKECEEITAKNREIPKQLDSDPMSRYLFLRSGQCVRIIRNSEISCQSVSYRYIIHKTEKNKE